VHGWSLSLRRMRCFCSGCGAERKDAAPGPESVRRPRGCTSPPQRLLVVIPRLNEFDPVGEHSINDTMFFGDSPAPATGEFMPQRLGFADALEGIGEDGRHQIEDPQRDLAVGLNPATQIFSKMR